jgi:hypothetical protein
VAPGPRETSNAQQDPPSSAITAVTDSRQHAPPWLASVINSAAGGAVADRGDALTVATSDLLVDSTGAPVISWKNKVWNHSHIILVITAI